MNDTPSEITQLQNKIYRNMDPVKRFKIGASFIDMGWNIKLNAIKTAYPQLSKYEIIKVLIKDIYNIHPDDL